MKAILHTMIYGCIFISICTVAFCMETNLLMKLRLNNFYFYLFVFCATLLEYNLHYFIKKSANPGSERFAWSQQHKHFHKIFIGIGLVGILISIFFFTLKHFIALAIIGAISALYSFPVLPFKKRKRIKDFGLLKIVTLSYIWTLVTVWFPVVNIATITPEFMLIFARRFLFMFILCLAFDIRDTPVDARDNIHTLPVMIGVKNCYLLIYGCLILFTALSVWYFYFVPDVMQLSAMIISALATYFMIDYSRTHRTDMTYLAGVDGMMLLQAILVGIGTL
jgi:4-hydroxybenzoate polyprenyltransferase